MAKSARDRFLKEYPDALTDDAGAVFIGAGVSRGAGYPSWVELLQDIGEELGVSPSDIHDLAALAQWSIQASGSQMQIKKVIRDQIAPDYPIPEPLKVLARLPIKHVWTTNYDRLIERAFGEIGRPCDAVSCQHDLAVRARPGAARVYKMHGSVDRLDDVVISTDDYELFRSRRGAYLPLLQAHLTSMSMLFVGLSFADPNVRHVLSLIRESFTEAPPEHFAIVRPPHRDDYKTEEEYKARATQHTLWARDLRRYGLLAVEIEDYDETPDLLKEVERQVSKRRAHRSYASRRLGGTTTRCRTRSPNLVSPVTLQERLSVEGPARASAPATVATNSRGSADVAAIRDPFPHRLFGLFARRMATPLNRNMRSA